MENINREYERLQKMEKFFMSLLDGASEDLFQIFRRRFKDIPMDVLQGLKGRVGGRNAVGQEIMERYRALCREKDHLELSQLIWRNPAARCYFKSSSAYSKLRPEKIEIFHENPKILVVHDLISPNRARSIVALSEDQMEAPLSISSGSGAVRSSSGRVGKMGFLQHHDNSSHSQLRKSVRWFRNIAGDLCG